MDLSGGWLDRYRAGDRDRVWLELRQLGRTIRDSESRFDQARLVCDEMAHRARRNVEVIVGRLTAQGYRFHSNDDNQTPREPHVAPGESAAEVSNWLTNQFDSVPLTLLSWLRIVGDVWLVGTHPDWSNAASADPLVIELEGAAYPGAPMTEYFEAEIDAWNDDGVNGRGVGTFVLPLAPDRLHKDNVSGGPPHGIIVPDGCVDGLFVSDAAMPFLSYLNWVFSRGGFPWPTVSPDQSRVTRALAADLLPL